MVALWVVAAMVSIAGAPASATFPGTNGVIVFYRFDPRPNQIFTIRRGGGGRTQLTSRRDNFEPAWSPRGSRIAFVRNSRSLWVMNADGSNQVRLISGPVGGNLIYLYEPAWSPTGRRIA